MAEFSVEQLQVLEAHRADAYREGDFKTAAARAREIYEYVPDGSARQGRAARDVAAATDRRGLYDTADEWAQRALGIHTALLQSNGSDPELLRERAVSATYAGVASLRLLYDGDDTEGLDFAALSHARTATKDFKALNELIPHVDQYEINNRRRLAVIEGAVGSSARGLWHAQRALRIARFSEAEGNPTSNPNLTPAQRAEAVRRARLGATAALGFVLWSATIPGRARSEMVGYATERLL